MNCHSCLERIAQGDDAAFAHLYRSMRTGLLAQAQALLAGDIAGAEDAVDEAFLDIWRRAGSFSGTGSAAGWVRRIVRNKAVDRLRKTGDRETVCEPVAFRERPDPAAGPEETALARNGRTRIRAALDILNPDQREAVVLCYFHEMPLEEIAEATGAPVGTVKTRLYYARRLLREHLSGTREAMPGARPQLKVVNNAVVA